MGYNGKEWDQAVFVGLRQGNTWGAMEGHGLTCGCENGEHMGCNARTWVNLWVCDWGTHGVQC